MKECLLTCVVTGFFEPVCVLPECFLKILFSIHFLMIRVPSCYSVVPCDCLCSSEEHHGPPLSPREAPYNPNTEL